MDANFVITDSLCYSDDLIINHWKLWMKDVLLICWSDHDFSSGFNWALAWDHRAASYGLQKGWMYDFQAYKSLKLQNPIEGRGRDLVPPPKRKPQLIPTCVACLFVCFTYVSSRLHINNHNFVFCSINLGLIPKIQCIGDRVQQIIVHSSTILYAEFQNNIREILNNFCF